MWIVLKKNVEVCARFLANLEISENLEKQFYFLQSGEKIIEFEKNA